MKGSWNTAVYAWIRAPSRPWFWAARVLRILEQVGVIPLSLAFLASHKWARLGYRLAVPHGRGLGLGPLMQTWSLAGDKLWVTVAAVWFVEQTRIQVSWPLTVVTRKPSMRIKRWDTTLLAHYLKVAIHMVVTLIFDADIEFINMWGLLLTVLAQPGVHLGANAWAKLRGRSRFSFR